MVISTAVLYLGLFWDGRSPVNISGLGIMEGADDSWDVTFQIALVPKSSQDFRGTEPVNQVSHFSHILWRKLLLMTIRKGWVNDQIVSYMPIFSELLRNSVQVWLQHKLSTSRNHIIRPMDLVSLNPNSCDRAVIESNSTTTQNLNSCREYLKAIYTTLKVPTRSTI